LEEGTEIKQDLLELIEVLKQDQISDYEIAKHLTEIAVVFVENTPAEQKEFVDKFRKQLGEFFRRAQVFKAREERRAQVAKDKSEEEIKAYDKKLCNNVGMIYVLEYYLTMNKAIAEAKTDEAKMYFVTGREVKIGEHDFPGLWHDFQVDEVLSKFILDLQSKEIRQKLLEVYYEVKSTFLSINVTCDLQGQCSAKYESDQVQAMQTKLKEFIQILLKLYSDQGITNLGSVFLKPNGDKPKLTDLPF